jgi:glycosyltransferase involved in cell wall biosynthesis
MLTPSDASTRVRRGVLIVGNQGSAIHGNRSVCEDLAENLSAAGWHVVSTSGRRSAFARLADMLTTTWRHREHYEIAQVDVFSGNAMIWAEAVCWVLRRTHKPYVLTLHGGNLPVFSRRWPRRVRRLLNSATIVTTPSGYLHENMAIYRGDLLQLPNPLDLAKYKFRLRDRPQARLVWLRAFHAMYNASLAADVVFKLRDEFPDVILTMIGPDKNDGSLSEFLKTVHRHQISESVVVEGFVTKPHVPKYLDAADIFINTTNVDNAPVSITEAMAAGLCVVSTNVGGIPYLIEHEVTGLLVPPNDAAAMSAAVGRLLKEPGLAARLSLNARRKAESYSKALVVQQWQEILAGVPCVPFSRTPSVQHATAVSRS